MNTYNPFSMTFGIEPSNIISRQEIENKIINEFTALEPSNYLFLLTGARGSGKTVLLTSLFNKFSLMDDFIVIDSYNKSNILESIASELYENKTVKKIFLKKQISFSFHGISLTINGERPISSVVVLIKEMLDIIKKEGKKVLITIDEVDNSAEMKEFVETYQSLLRYKYPVLLLMTGLFENISRLQENKSLTFLYRAPKIYLGPLNKRDLAMSYSSLLEIDLEKAINYAKLTKGYAYAYQTLGYLIYESKQKELTNAILSEFDKTMYDYVYDKMYSELSEKEKTILQAINTNDKLSVSSVCEKTKINIKEFSVYRDRLIKKGIIYSPSYGYIEFALPRFKEFMLFV